MASRLAWYRNRLRAMTPAERVWRAGAPAVAATDRLRRRPASVRFATGPWPDALRELAAGLSTADDAARIAAGELSFWGRTVTVSPTSPAWAADPFTGVAAIDPKHTWELHRHQHLVPLALAGDPGDVAAAQLADWVARNPRRSGGPAWSSGYETAHRLVSWAWTIPFLDRSFAPSYLEQTRFATARPSRFSSANNHRLAELVGLSYAAVLADELAWYRELSDELDAQAITQTYADGGSREQASGYFLYVLELLWAAALLRRAADKPLGRLGTVLERMVSWAYAVGDHELEPPAFGDDAEDRMLRLEYFEPRRARTIVGRARAVLDARNSLLRASGSAVLDSGLAVLRRGGLRVVFDVGELGYGALAAHGHADALAVTADRDGRPLLRDSGTGSYLEREGRELLRSTAAHNTVEIGSASQAESLGPHLWGERFSVEVEHAALTDAYDYVRARHDGYLRRFGAVHRRSVLLLDAFLLVIDEVEAASAQDIRLHWHVEPEAELHVASSPKAAFAEEPFGWSPRYGTWVIGTRATSHLRASKVRFASVLGAVTGVELDGDAVRVGTITIVERFDGEPEVRR